MSLKWMFHIVLKKWSGYISWSYLFQRPMPSLTALSQPLPPWQIWGEKSEKNGEKRDFAMPFQNTIRFLFCLGGTSPGRAGVGSLWPSAHPTLLKGEREETYLLYNVRIINLAFWAQNHHPPFSIGSLQKARFLHSFLGINTLFTSSCWETEFGAAITMWISLKIWGLGLRIWFAFTFSGIF